MTHKQVEARLASLADKKKAAFFPYFFKTGKGQYGEGDVFIGVTVPKQRLVAGEFKALSESELKELLKSPVHEHRLTALIILTLQFKAARNNLQQRKQITDFYLNNRQAVNNWDLVDSSADKILGEYALLTGDTKQIEKFAVSKDLWERRIAMISCFAFIKSGRFELPLQIADLLHKDREDLIQKAVGWMLREAGKRNSQVLEEFLQKRYTAMPRTMLRYAIEKMPEQTRQAYLKGKI